MTKDEYAVVLDFLPHGKASDRKAEPLAQVIGEKFLNLLEVIIREDASTKTGEKIYIGDEKRDKVKYIRGRISYGELTNFAKSELENVIVDFINKDEIIICAYSFHFICINLLILRGSSDFLPEKPQVGILKIWSHTNCILMGFILRYTSYSHIFSFRHVVYH